MSAAGHRDDGVVELQELRRLVCAAAARFDPASLLRDDAVAALEAWSAIAGAAHVGSALSAARVEECGVPRSAGAASPAEFVARATGTTANRAKEAIAHGTRLGRAERTRAAAAEGQLSPEQAAAISDAAAVNPDAEAELLREAATAPLGELRRRCAERKAERQDLAAIEEQIHRRRCLRRYRDADGAEHLHATGTARDMVRIDLALRSLTDARFAEARRAGRHEPREAYAFDALVALADRAAEPQGRRRDPIRHLAVLRLDVSALRRGHVEAGETCEIAGLGPVSVAAAREMLGESVLKLVLTDGVEVRNVTHLGRGPTAAQQVALQWEQPCCRRLGCGRRARLQYDHVDGFEFRRTRHTRVDELDLLCQPDHDLKTYEGWALVPGTGVRAMVPPDDPRHPRQQQRQPAADAQPP